ncbi:MAG: T9SS type A sorting domain-containing protein [Paludibacter sp.]|nr:T9SS type A sorting domain-containing protein [Paludibacter sp.]
MKKKIYTLAIVTTMLFGTQIKAQTVLADFETDITSSMQGAWGEIKDADAFTIVDNPLKTGINTSAKCLKVLHKSTFAPWGNADWYGINMTLEYPFDIVAGDANHYLHFKYNSGTVGAVMSFELYDPKTNLGNGCPTVSETGKWIEVVIDLNSYTSAMTQISKIYIMPDKSYQSNGHTADEITYFDDIVINDVATVTTGLKNIDKSSLSVFPNPCADLINIKDAAGSKLHMYNNVGQEVKTVKIDSNLQSVGITGLSKGIYLIKLTKQNGNEASQKLVVK